MATAVMRNMSHGQHLHVLPNNCVIVSPTSGGQPSPVMMHQHQNAYTHHMAQQQQQQQQHQQSQELQQVTNLMHQQTTQHHHQQHTHHQQQQQQHHHHNHHQHQTHQLGKRPIAPAPPADRSTVISNLDQNRVNSISSSANSKKAKMNYTHMPYGTIQPASVQRRNARERNRVKQVNNGFANLRQHIPTDVVQALTSGGRGASKKLSKVDTLRLAVEYIRRLKDLIEDDDAASTSSSRLSQNSTGSESSASPTPSYSSDNSSVENTTLPLTSYKYEVFDAYNPEDEELLDCITWWQQQ